VFSYKYINPTIYPYGITLWSLDKNRSIVIATKEKALSDMLYFSSKITNESQIKEYVFENLRIDSEEFATFDLKIMRQIAADYGYNVNLLCKMLEKLK